MKNDAYSTSTFVCICVKWFFIVFFTFLSHLTYHLSQPFLFHYFTSTYSSISTYSFIHFPPLPFSNPSSLSPDNSASIVSRRRDGFSQDRDQGFFSLVLVVADGGEPPLSSTATLSLRVCVCQRNTRGRNSNICQAQAFLSSAGLSTGAFVAILLCIIILLGKYVGAYQVYLCHYFNVYFSQIIVTALRKCWLCRRKIWFSQVILSSYDRRAYLSCTDVKVWITIVKIAL